jgi:hypothetical protein
MIDYSKIDYSKTIKAYKDGHFYYNEERAFNSTRDAVLTIYPKKAFFGRNKNFYVVISAYFADYDESPLLQKDMWVRGRVNGSFVGGEHITNAIDTELYACLSEQFNRVREVEKAKRLAKEAYMNKMKDKLFS